MLLTLFLVGFLIFAGIMMFILSSSVLGFLATRVPFVPTNKADIKPLVEYLKLTEQDVVYELGSGNGKVVFLFEKYSSAKVIGIESTLWTHLWAKIKKFFIKSKSRFIYGNFFKESLRDATVVYMYLYPPLMPGLSEKFLTDLRPGTRIVSRDFPNRHLNQIDSFKTPSNHTMYVYKI